MNKKIQIPELQRRAETIPKTLDKEKRTIEVVFSTGAKVLRTSWFSEPYYEELSLDPAHVRLDRLNNGAPCLKVHDDSSLENVLGVTVSANVDGKEGTSIIRFSDRPDVDPVFNDISNGILRHFSVGYKVYKFEELPRGEEQFPTFRAIDWEPLEISCVPVGADDAAVVRSNTKSNECEFKLLEEIKMNKKIKTRSEDGGAIETPAAVADPEKVTPVEGEAPVETTPENAQAGTTEKEPVIPAESTPDGSVEQARAEGTKTERLRVSEIRKIATTAKLNNEYADKLINDGVPLNEARKMVIDHLADLDQKKQTRTARVEVIGNMDEKLVRMQGCENAILHRYDPKKYDLTDVGYQFRNMSLLDIAREHLEGVGVKTRGMDRDQVVKRAFLDTSDFPNLLANVATKSMRDAYQIAPQTFEPFVRRTFLPDFKAASRVQMGDAPSLEKVNSSGEIKHGSVSDEAETIQLETYSKIVSITRKAIINDDLEGFTRLPALMAIAARNLESNLVWAAIMDNPVMADGYRVFEAAHHKNYTGSGTAISIDALSVGRKMMRQQKGENGTVLDINPVYLFVPTSKQTLAEQYCAQLTATGDSSKVNPFGGKLIPIAEPRLDGAAGSTISWYMMAAASTIDIVELASLVGQTEPIIETKIGFEIDGMEIKCTRDVGAKAMDYRGMYMNVGA